MDMSRLKKVDNNYLEIILVNPEDLLTVKERLFVHDPLLLPALRRLQREADEALNLGPFSVVNKVQVPPSGDKHDYMSLAKYWWPNPVTPNGLPYIRRDGETNPDANRQDKFDRKTLGLMIKTVTTLALAYLLVEEESYAVHASELLKTWFLYPDTRMNPNLKYAQAIPGAVDGRGTGIIDSRGFAKIIDAVGMLQGSTSWTPQNHQALKVWFSEYLDWLINSKNGQDEANAANNHGTMYDFQVSALALFTGNIDLARKTILKSRIKRIASQIEPDGSQPLELARTKGLDYSVLNLTGLLNLTLLGRHIGINLGEYCTDDGRSIRSALEWITPYLLTPEDWPYKQIVPYQQESAYHLFKLAAVCYEDDQFEKYIHKLTIKKKEDNRLNLLYPSKV